MLIKGLSLGAQLFVVLRIKKFLKKLAVTAGGLLAVSVELHELAFILYGAHLYGDNSLVILEYLDESRFIGDVTVFRTI